MELSDRCTSCLIFAQMTFEELSQAMRVKSSGMLPVIMSAFLVILVAIILVFLYLSVRRERREHLDSGPKLFQDLCLAHEIGWLERRLLKELARMVETDAPERLFVRPDLFQLGLERWRLLHPGQSDQALVLLARRLFAGETAAGSDRSDENAPQPIEAS